MQKLRQILLFLDRGTSQRNIQKEAGVSRKAIAAYVEKFRQTGSSYSELLNLSDTALKDLMAAVSAAPAKDLDPRTVHFLGQITYFLTELKRNGVTRLLLWEEYIKDYPIGFQYSRFCELLQENARVESAVMHFDHLPAEMLQVDFAGDDLHYIDQDSGQLIKCPVFIAVLPFSGYGYVEALPDARLPRVVSALNNTLNYLGGVPRSVKSDNMRQWVSRSCKYEPVFTEMLQQWANHNQIALLAARPYKPKDKSSVENLVNIIYQRVYAKLRNQTFYSLPDLNRAIREKLAEHHQLNFQKKTFSRSELFSCEEKHLLQPLPESPYSIWHYTKAKVQKNYHVVLGEDWNFYSVPFRYIGKSVRIIYNSDTVEIYHDGQRIAVHARNYKKHSFMTLREHMPPAHQAITDQRGWNPQYYLQQAAANGPCTHHYFKKVMEGKLILEQSYSSCLGMLRLIKEYGPERMEAACKRALTGHRFTYRTVKTILENKTDLLEAETLPEYRIPEHTNLRGPDAYRDN